MANELLPTFAFPKPAVKSRRALRCVSAGLKPNENSDSPDLQLSIVVSSAASVYTESALVFASDAFSAVNRIHFT